MAWRFRRSVRILPGVRLNFGSKSMSVRLGPRGAGYTISSTGRHTVSAGIPGTGLYNTQVVRPAARKQPLAAPPSQFPAAASTGRSTASSLGLVLLAIIGIGIVLAIFNGSSTPSSPPSSSAKPLLTQAAPANPAPSPQPNRPLAGSEILEAQQLLYALGFDPGPRDGIAGPNTIAAVKRYEASRGWPVAGALDLRLLESIRSKSKGTGH